MTIDPKTIPELLNWYEGMLLSPSHFQHAVRRQESLAGWQAQNAAPHAWGVRRLESQLTGTLFQVTFLEAVTSDRMMITFPYSPAPAPLSIDLADAFERGQDRVYVHLAVVAWSPQAFGVGGSARYSPVAGEPTEARDSEFLDDRPESMRETPWLRPVLELRKTGSPLDGLPAPLIGLPLACFVQQDAALVRTLYQPPSLTLATALSELDRVGRTEPAATPVRDYALAVEKELVEKAKYLKGRLAAATDPKPAVATTSDAEPKMDLQAVTESIRGVLRQALSSRQMLNDLNAVTRTLPRLHALICDDATHPHDAFLALCDVLGDLSVINGAYRLPDALPKYEHRDALKSFEDVFNQITRILENLNQRYRAIPFERQSPSRFALRMRPPSTDLRFTIAAIRRPGQNIDKLQLWMENALIATEGNADGHMKKLRTLGAHRQVIDRDADLDLDPTSERWLYRVVDANGDFDKLDTTLVVDGVGDDGPAQLLLYVRASDATPRASP